ncbi:Uncharacterised protein [Candidatus Venteria ishoeyi]|uniref:Peptidase S54 rhomboid domain-containing protein n=1 Tax=Candidatus Venteria ishoeyi TaxID=1899563 RepID=A0A1H6F5S1_9GAMM|nr:Uncharacterised protein [Candidatus Venteria ishoeyi]
MLRQDNRLLAISLAVAFMYGGMIWGIFPNDPKISFEAHAMGMLSGVAMAIYYRKEGPQRKRYSWEIEEEEEAEKQRRTPGPSDSSDNSIKIFYDWKEKEEE